MTLTDRQQLAYDAMASTTNTLLFGGSRSGKTFVAINFIVEVCLLAPKTRALVCRRYATDARASLWAITIPEVLRLMGLESGTDYSLNNTNASVRFANGSTIICTGLDDKERVDKILGQEYLIIYLNESYDIPWATVNTLKTRLSQVVMTPHGRAGARLIADLNPGSTSHWTHRLWIEGIHPETREPLPKPERYKYLQLNPHDNAANLPADYIDQQLGSLVGGARQRFLLGEYDKGVGVLIA